MYVVIYVVMHVGQHVIHVVMHVVHVAMHVAICYVMHVCKHVIVAHVRYIDIDVIMYVVVMLLNMLCMLCMLLDNVMHVVVHASMRGKLAHVTTIEELNVFFQLIQARPFFKMPT